MLNQRGLLELQSREQVEPVIVGIIVGSVEQEDGKSIDQAAEEGCCAGKEDVFSPLAPRLRFCHTLPQWFLLTRPNLDKYLPPFLIPSK